MDENKMRKIAGFLRFLPDKLYLNLRFYKKFRRWINWDDPQTYNEKLQWLKIYNRLPVYNKIVDKYDAKEYVSQRIGAEYIIPTLGVWDRFEDIDFSKLPDRFVLKCTHDSGGLVICKNKAEFDKQAAAKKINACLKSNYFWFGREWPYKDLKPRIIAEQYMEDAQDAELRDYKFFTFGGEPKLLYVATDRVEVGEDTKFDFFDMEYNHLNIQNGHPNAKVIPHKPACFEKMKELAATLSEGIPHLRVDFYEVNGQIYFGELTLFHMSGMMPFEPKDWDYTLGSWINIKDLKDK